MFFSSIITENKCPILIILPYFYFNFFYSFVIISWVNEWILSKFGNMSYNVLVLRHTTCVHLIWQVWVLTSTIMCFSHPGLQRLASLAFELKNKLRWFLVTTFHLFSFIFCNCYLAAPRPTLAHYQGDSLTHSMLITVFYIFDPKVTGCLIMRLGP